MKDQSEIMRLLLILLLAWLASVNARAYDFKVNGICYETTMWASEGASVTYEQSGSPSYSSIASFVNIPSSVQYKDKAWLVYHIKNNSFYGCSSINQVSIANTVMDIGDKAFFNCSGLIQVQIGDAVTKIGSHAFDGCTNLNNVKMGVSVNEIGTEAFRNCTFLYFLTIPDRVETIGSGAFQHCNQLTSITIGKSVNSVGQDAFALCNNLKEVNISDLEAWCSIRFVRSEAEWSNASNPLYYAHHLYLNGAEIKDLVIPGTVSGVNKLAFAGCLGLTSVTIPNSAYYIGERAFDQCKGLSTVTIGSGIIYIEQYAFTGCSGLKTIYSYANPNSIEMGDYVFTGVNKGDVTLHVTPEHYDAYRNAAQWNEFNIVGDLGDQDVNRDNEVNVGDVNVVLGAILAEDHCPAYDVNYDLEVNVADVNVILTTILGVPSPGGEPDKPVTGETKTYTVNGVSFKMVKVSGGTFSMGATDEQGTKGEADENPVHQVTLSDFWIGETEVTESLWKAVMGSNPSYSRKGDNYPVENISWNDCQTFINKLNSLTGEQFFLPTEAQWEYSARGGNKSKNYRYAGGNDRFAVAWFNSNSGGAKHPVATKQCNELGLYDMSGNVDEWCRDWYGSYSASAQTNPTGPSSGTNRVSRGGGWDDSDGRCRVSSRRGGWTSDKNNYLGLRLVR